MFQRILAPLDGSEFAAKTLPYVESLAKRYDSEVILFWVVQLRTYTVSDFQPMDYGVAALLDTTAEKDRADQLSSTSARSDATTSNSRLLSNFRELFDCRCDCGDSP